MMPAMSPRRVAALATVASPVATVVVSLALAACGSEVTPDDGSGGAGGASSSAASSPTSSTPSSSSTSSGSSQSSGDVSAGQGGDGGGDVTTVGPGGGCSPLDEETLDRIDLTGNGAGKLLANATAHPGDVVQFEIGTFECCYSFEPVAACATFTLDDASPATVDPLTGLVTVSADAAHGSIVNVTADVEDGRRFLDAALYIWTEEGNPLVGLYTELAQLDCGDGSEVEPEQVIGELRLGADNRFGVTWSPFEVYVDYWGSYTFDLETGAIELTVDGGNYVPDDIDPIGTFALEGDDLVLRDLWLGTPQDGAAPAQCGHVFQ
jgi:hypothetical protein